MTLAREAPQQLDIRPGVRMLALFPHMNYKPWYALGEFVDNALQSYLDNKVALRKLHPDYVLRVKITLDSDNGQPTLRIVDNAAGIAAKDYGRAFTTAEPPPNREGLSQFGIGMKSAGCWFARNFTVRSTALGESVCRTVTFDVPEIAKHGTEHLTPRLTAARLDDHFTEIVLKDLYQVPIGRTVGKIRDHLRSMYRVFLRRGELELYFDRDPLTYDEPQVLEAPPAENPAGKELIWRKDISIEFGGARAAGFAAIRKTASTAKAGFALFRSDRLIQGSDEDSYRPVEIFGRSNSYRYQRLFGEFHLKGVDVSHTKDVFQWGDLEQPFLDALRKQLDAPPLRLLRQAEDYRARQANKELVVEADRAAERTLAAVEQLGEAIVSELAQPLGDPAGPSKLDVGPSASRREVSLDIDGETWSIVLDLSTDPTVAEWLSLFDTEAGPAGARKEKSDVRRLGIRLALLHPFMTQFGGTTSEELEPLVRVATGLAIAETLAREAGVRMAQEVRTKLNRLLEAELARPRRLL